MCCVCCFVCLRLMCLLLPVSLDCPFLIDPSVFSNVYLPVSLDCPFLIAPSVFSNVYLPVSLECPFLITPSVFSNVYLPVSLDCPFVIAPSVFSNVYLPVSLECPFLISPKKIYVCLLSHCQKNLGSAGLSRHLIYDKLHSFSTFFALNFDKKLAVE
jgi:hypothetical protein